MRRKLFSLAAALSLLLFVAVCVLCVRSYYAGDQWVWSDGAERPRHVYRMGHRYVLALTRGHVYLMHDTSWWYPPQFRHVRLDPPFVPTFMPPFVPRRSVLGLEWAAHEGVPVASSVLMPPFLLYRIVGIPYWFLAASTALAPVLGGVRAWRLRRRLRQGLCQACGYDLRATPDRCPERGTVVNPAPAA